MPVADQPMPGPPVHTEKSIDLAAEASQNVEWAAEALLREHPDALVCGLSSNGLIVPIPGRVALWGQAAIEGRAVIDGGIRSRTKRPRGMDMSQAPRHR
jgi:hypothetical protein